VLARRLNSLPHRVTESRRIALGIYQGLDFGIALHPYSGPDVYLEGAATRQGGFLSENQGPRAILNAVDRLANGLVSECERIQQDLAIAQAQLRDYQARLGKPFVHQAYLSELTALRDALKAGLSGTPPEDGAEPPLPVSEIAEKVKALIGRSTVEASPKRASKRAASAEEPVTARILRRQQNGDAADAETWNG
jgi:hypothetical protein